MKHYTIKEPLNNNSELIFKLNKKVNANKIKVSCSTFYTLYLNDKVVDFGPERTAEGYTRIKTIDLKEKIDSLYLKVIHYGIPTFDLDFQPFFIAVELFDEDNIVSDLHDFVISDDEIYIKKSSKLDFQRAYLERYDLNGVSVNHYSIKELDSPIELESLGQTCLYHEMKATPFESGENLLLEKVARRRNLSLFPDYKDYPAWDIFFEDYESGYHYDKFKLDGNKTGLLKLVIDSKVDDQIVYVLFDEMMVNNTLMVERGNIMNLVQIKVRKGHYEIISPVCNTMQYIFAFTKDGVSINPSLILIQNDLAKIKTVTNDEDIKCVLEASKNTFMQNAFDLYTDCPGRERAGWLCDGYFTAMGEQYFVGSLKMEKHFLENFLLCKCEELNPIEMVPMCFPSTHWDHNFIPNWALWFILQLDKYYQDTNDDSLFIKGKKRIYELMDYFTSFENEYGLLENLKAWVFIEWSEAGSPDYVKGVNFPTNMTYSAVLKAVGGYYHDQKLLDKAKRIKDTINEMSFDGCYYHDNAIRNNGALEVIKEHVSETAQYYALFFEMTNNESFAKDMVENFSLTQISNPNNMPKSNVFIGCYLRILWLLRRKEHQRILGEVVPYFTKMAKITKTLWEKDTPDASCNHGLNAAIAPIIDECLKNIKA